MCSNDDDGWHFGWVVLAATFFINLIADGYCFVFGIIRLYIEEDYPNYSPWMIAIIGGLVRTVYLTFAPVCFAINEFLGPVRAIAYASIISTLGFLLAWANAYYQIGFWFDLLTLGIVQGISSALLYSSSLAAIDQYFPTNQRALAIGVTMCGSPVGAIFYSIIIPPLFDAFGLRGSLAIFAGLSFNGCVCATVFLNGFKRRKHVIYQQPPDHDERHLADSDIVPVIESLPQPTVPTQQQQQQPMVTQHVFGDNGHRPPDDRDNLPIPHCYIMQKILEDKLRSRLDTNHSLDNAIITRDNILIRAYQQPQSTPNSPQTQEKGQTIATANREQSGVKTSETAPNKKLLPDSKEKAKSSSGQEQQKETTQPTPTLTEVLKKYFNAKLISEPSFICLLGAAAFSVIGYFIPMLLVVGQARNPNFAVTLHVQRNLLLLWGIFNLLGRAAFSQLVDFGLKSTMCASFWIFIIGNGISALILLIFPKVMLIGDNAFVLFVIAYGFFIAPLTTMQNIIARDLYGESNANASIGWFLFIQGAVQMLGFVLPTWLDAISATYAYRFGAACFIMSCILVGLTYKPFMKARKEAIFKQESAKLSNKAHRRKIASKKRHRV